MIKFLANKDGVPVFGLGLSEANIEKLIAGNPIVVDLKQMGLTVAAEVFIFYGLDEHTMVADLRREGLLTSDSKISNFRESQ